MYLQPYSSFSYPEYEKGSSLSWDLEMSTLSRNLSSNYLIVYESAHLIDFLFVGCFVILWVRN